ncbi:YfhO family protein [Flagellimonas meishanensis]|uniref:YfhO family protein n=1 Tax=Flagellimonas meishanensis TaxID=2873264 RepID=UPI003AACFE5F
MDYRPNYLKYRATNTNDGFAVFSEMHYPKGWKASVDGQPQPIYRVNYALRGIKVPAGEHEIEFTFEPEVVQMGSQIALGGCIVLGLIIVGGIGYSLRPKKSKKE